MNQYLIANPPCGIYSGDLPLHYAYYHTLLDIHSRFLSEFKDLEVTCPKYSLNALGKRAENLGLDGSIKSLDDHVRKWASQGYLRDRMNFSFQGDLFDTSQESVEQTTKVFRQLYEKGYSFREGDTFYLDIEKIRNDFDLEGILQDIHFFSDRNKREFRRIIKNSESQVKITKNREYSVPNPFGGEGISPIFGIANLWEGHFNQKIDLIVSAEKELTRYLMLRFLSQVPILDRLPMQNILLYNKIAPEGDFNEWDMEELTLDGVNSDALRYAFAKSFSLSKQKTQLKKSLLLGGKKLIYLTGNLKNFFLKKGGGFKGFPEISDEEYSREMDDFKYFSTLGNLERNLKRVSIQINNSRDRENLDSKPNVLFNEYLSLVRKLIPFCPFITQKVIKDLSQ